MKRFARFWINGFAYVAGWAIGFFLRTGGLATKTRERPNEVKDIDLEAARVALQETNIDPAIRHLKDRFGFGPIIVRARRDTPANTASDLIGVMRGHAIAAFQQEYAAGTQLPSVTVWTDHRRAGRVLRFHAGFVFKDVEGRPEKFSIEMPLCEATRLRCLDRAMTWVWN